MGARGDRPAPTWRNCRATPRRISRLTLSLGSIDAYAADAGLTGNGEPMRSDGRKRFVRRSATHQRWGADMPEERIGSVIVETFPLPPPGFDPIAIDTSASDLDRYGFPPRPDPTVNRVAAARWQAAFRHYRECRHLVPTFEVSELRHSANHRTEVDGAGDGTSTNWSGSTLPIGGGDTFSWIAGSWTVPDANAVPGVADPNACVAVWLGIDGDKGADGNPSNDVVQAGTDTYPNGTCFVWAEWFPGLTIKVKNVPAKPGDAISLSVYASSATRATFNISNITAKAQVALGIHAPTGTVLVGNCAEAIVERPDLGHQTVPLPRYGKVVFSDTAAHSVNGESLDIGAGVLTDMLDDLGAKISVPNLEPQSDDLTVAYVGP